MYRSAIAGTAICALVLGACSGGTSRTELAEGAATPEQAVETFLSAAADAQRARRDNDLDRADRAYDRMAAVFGTETGSITRTFSADEVRNRMLVLAACLRPTEFRLLASYDPGAAAADQATITTEIQRDRDTVTAPFRLVRGRGDRWFVVQIEMSGIEC